VGGGAKGSDLTTGPPVSRIQTVSERERFEYIVNTSRDFITLIDRSYVYVLANDSYCRAMEKARDEIVGRSVAEVWGAERFEKEIKRRLDDCFAGREIEYIDRFKFGPFEKHMHVNCYPFVENDGRITHALVFSHDVTHITQIESKLTHYEFRDPVTGLFNRRSLEIILEKEIEDARRPGGGSRALLYLGLRGLGRVNEVYGHAVGDLILENTGLRIQRSLRAGDFVFRFEGNELACLVTRIDRGTDAAVIARKLVEQISLPYHHPAGDIHVTCAIGVAVFPGDGERGADLVRNASTAMREARRREAGFVLFNEALHDSAATRLTLESDMHQAFGRNEFRLVFQPIVDMLGRIKGAEALIRWQHPTRGLIPPGDFIPVAEQSGIIESIGRWALFTAAEHLARWAPRHGVYLSINLAARDFLKDDLASVLLAALKRAGTAAPAFLKLEVTESQCMADPEDTIRRMARLAEAGFELFVDDFGTGSSSLGYLKRLPAGTIKIDRFFVDEAIKSPEDLDYLKNIVSIVRSRRKSVILEGIETSAQFDLLRRLEIDGMQGFHFSRPLSSEQLDELLTSGAGLPVAR
jgi:diguanylate cyclase (GGDEF)-like protein/PAS domain S-box-containing protein